MKLFILFFFFCSPVVNAVEINADMISFRYTPNELPSVSCTHEITNPNSGDWTVKCPFYNEIKEFSVHLLLRKYQRQAKPQNRYEVIYWVTNRLYNKPLPEFTGSTLWLNFENETTPHSFNLAQQVDNSYANLDLKLNLLGRE